MSIKNYVIAGVFLSLLNTSLPAQNSDQSTYYRTFSVELKKIDQETEQKLNELFNQRNSFMIEDVCAAGSKILVAVDAKYPKRVDDIKVELLNIISSQLGKRQVIEVLSIPYDKQNTYCL